MLSFILSFFLLLLVIMSVAPNKFASELFHTIAKEKLRENFIFSPASIETLLALAYLGADGNTASELQRGLRIGAANRQQVAEHFGQLGAKTKAGAVKLKMANRIYVDRKYAVAPEFSQLARKYFDSDAERIHFGESDKAAEKINAWVEEQTNNRIKDIVQPGSFSGDIGAVLVNAVHFKANWVKTFNMYSTKAHDFHVSNSSTVSVDMMYQADTFLFGDLTDLDATAVELAYRGTDISMLVILPKATDGLSALEDKLRDVDVTKISEQLENKNVRLRLPKFKFEFNISLQPVLVQLGIMTMFTPAADFSRLLASTDDLSISQFKHKAFIDVNENGTEATAATYIRYKMRKSTFISNVDFTADHPFYFAIKDSETVYFAGHVAQLRGDFIKEPQNIFSLFTENWINKPANFS